MNKRTLLTPAFIDVLESGYINDPQVPGLSIHANRHGRRMWKYRRRIASSRDVLKLTLGLYPTLTIADARACASKLNDQVEAGLDPRAVAKAEEDRLRLTVAFAHERYMAAVREGRGSSAKKINKPRTIADKLAIYRRDIEPQLADKLIFAVTEKDLANLVLAKGKDSKVRANRLASELNVFFGWAASLRGTEINLPTNPAARLADLKFPETPRDRRLSLEEIGWYLRSVAIEPSHYQRGMLLWLLTAARISEVIFARRDEIEKDVWVVPPDRVKNRKAHRIPLGPWGRSLMTSHSEWLFPSPRTDGPLAPRGWYKARDRVLQRMAEFAGRPIPRWTPHDMRRTARSNTRRLNTDFETAEAMLNHAKCGLERIYDGYAMEDEKRRWFQIWEDEIIRIARAEMVADALGCPPAGDPLPQGSIASSPRCTGLQPLLDIAELEARAAPKFTGAAR